ncbi:uncharacterized protein isoform X2 [Rhodnius prolixus]|uniref:uncharacterized protein isoform X2 n=1 Tax=Rhodnius prolixus TaxID=13249 RepID=UPI003D1877C8
MRERFETRLPKRSNVIVTYPPMNKSSVISFGANDTVYHVTEKCVKQFNLNPNGNEQYVLRYANEILDPLLVLSQSKIPEGAEFIIQLAPDIVYYPNVNVKLIDREEGCASGAKFRENENLWNVAQRLIPTGKYVDEDRMGLCHENHLYVGRKELERTSISSLRRKNPQIVLTLEPVRSYDLIKSKTKNKKETSKKKLTRSGKKSKKMKIGEDNESEQIALIRSKLWNNDKNAFIRAAIAKMEGIVYLGSREGVAYKTSTSTKSLFSLSTLNSYSKYSLDIVTNNSSNLRDDGNMEICVNFPEGVSIKGFFRPHETVEDVYGFIKPFLKNPDQEFYLYTASPRLIMPHYRTVKDIVYLPPYNTLYVSFGVSNSPQKSYLKDYITKYMKVPNSTSGLNINKVTSSSSHETTCD